MFEDTTYRNNTSAERAETTSQSAVDGRVLGGTGSGRAGPVHGRCGPSRSTGRIREDRAIGDLVEAARRGDQAAWIALVRRYVPLVRAVTRTYRLGEKDAEDVSQFVW